jgi:hypothetical protein
MRKCIKCGEKKEIELFRRNGRYYKHTCLECCNSPFRTGKVNTGRFKKGIKPINGFKKNHQPWNVGIPHTAEVIEKIRLKTIARAKGRYTWKSKDWAKRVKERDGYKCQECGSELRIHAHHIVPWKESEELRFDINNGKTLCQLCHTKLEGYRIGHKPTEETLEKMRTSHKGQRAWNKGKQFSEETKKKMSAAKKGKPAWNKEKKTVT